MKQWLGYALCMVSACYGQVDSYGLPPIERGLAGSNLLHSSEGSSGLPGPSKPESGGQAILFHSVENFGNVVQQSGFRWAGTWNQYTYSVDVFRMGWDQIQSERLRIGLTVPLGSHRMGARLVTEQWFRTEGARPWRLYPEIAFWSTFDSEWNYAIRVVNPTRVKWSQSEEKTDSGLQGELCRSILDKIQIHLGWRTQASESIWSLGSSWDLSERFSLVSGIASGAQWLSFGTRWRLNNWGIHMAAQLQDHTGWEIAGGLSWRSP